VCPDEGQMLRASRPDAHSNRDNILSRPLLIALMIPKCKMRRPQGCVIRKVRP
jgi:hypothetical protein